MPIRAILAAYLFVFCGAASAAPLVMPFDFSRHAIGINGSVKGKPLYVLLDTGVNPSVIDIGLATSLGLSLNRKAAGQGNGEGGGTTLAVPTVIPGPEFAGHSFGNIEALATDLRSMSKSYGHRLDGVFGYSFLSSNTVLIDYPSRTLTIQPGGFGPDLAAHCRLRRPIPFASNDGNQFPVVRNARFGIVEAPVTLDTGSNRTIGFYQAALQVPVIRNALSVESAERGASFGGSYTTQAATLRIPFGIGPFMLPAGQKVSIMPTKGIPGKRLANIGNGFFDALKASLLVDYPRKRLALLGDCGKPAR